MTAIDKNPKSLNFLSPINFRFFLRRAPNLNFEVQRVNIPGIRMGHIMLPGPILAVPEPGDHILYNELDIEFKLDEEMANYLEIHNWIKGLGFPDSQDQYKDLVAGKPPGEGKESDIEVQLLSSSRNMIFDITFRDAFPIYLSDIVFDATKSGIDYLTTSASFRYLSYNIVRTINP